MDFKKIIGAVAPTIATFIGGPLAGGAVKAGLAAFGVTGEDAPENVDDATALLAQKVQTATPGELLALKNSDNKFKVEMRKLDIKEDQAYLSDTQNARAKNADNRNVFRLGVVVLATFAAMVGATLYGAYKLITGGMGADIDPGVIAAVFSLIGTLIGYAAANAQQVIAFFFGSSKGSKQKTDAMAEAFKNFPR